jgi:hypothetical protein
MTTAINFAVGTRNAKVIEASDVELINPWDIM